MKLSAKKQSLGGYDVMFMDTSSLLLFTYPAMSLQTGRFCSRWLKLGKLENLLLFAAQLFQPERIDQRHKSPRRPAHHG